MRILALNQFYAPDHSATSQLLTELCEDLVAAGDDVTVIASRGSYLGGERWPGRETRRGVHVVRPLSTSWGKGSVPRRLADYLTFWASAVASALTESRPDVILALTTPPLIAAGAAMVASARRVPLVSWVQDVYPEVAAAFGVLGKSSVAYRTLAQLTRLTHQKSARIVALSQGMQERLVAQGAATERISVICNWADGSLLRPLPHTENAFRREQGIEGRFVIMYSGNLGVGHEFETLLEAAGLLEASCPEALFVFIGDGARLAETKGAARILRNVRFLPYQPRERLAESLAAADVHLISLREGLDGLLVPSKLYGALASGRPVCYVGPEPCDVTRTLLEHACGATRRPGDGAGLASDLMSLYESPEARTLQGKRARQAFERLYDRPVAVAAWRRVLERAVAAGSDVRTPGTPGRP